MERGTPVAAKGITAKVKGELPQLKALPCGSGFECPDIKVKASGFRREGTKIKALRVRRQE